MIRRHLLRGTGGSSSKAFSTSARRRGYEDTIGNLKIGKDTRVIFQGFTGISLPSSNVLILGLLIILAGRQVRSHYWKLLSLNNSDHCEGNSKCQRIDSMGHQHCWRRHAR